MFNVCECVSVRVFVCSMWLCVRRSICAHTSRNKIHLTRKKKKIKIIKDQTNANRNIPIWENNLKAERTVFISPLQREHHIILLIWCRDQNRSSENTKKKQFLTYFLRIIASKIFRQAIGKFLSISPTNIGLRISRHFYQCRHKPLKQPKWSRSRFFLPQMLSSYHTEITCILHGYNWHGDCCQTQSSNDINNGLTYSKPSNSVWSMRSMTWLKYRMKQKDGKEKKRRTMSKNHLQWEMWWVNRNGAGVWCNYWIGLNGTVIA